MKASAILKEFSNIAHSVNLNCAHIYMMTYTYLDSHNNKMASYHVGHKVANCSPLICPSSFNETLSLNAANKEIL